MGKVGVNKSKMKNKEVFNLLQSLNSIKGLKGVRFNYAVAKNISKLESETESMKKSIEVSPEFKAYDDARIELAKSHAKKDEKGSPIIENNQFILEDKEKFTKEFDELKEKNKEVISAREEQIKDFESLLEEESDIETFKIKISEVPEEITTEQMTALLPLIEE
jgi:hypothetical protein